MSTLVPFVEPSARRGDLRACLADEERRARLAEREAAHLRFHIEEMREAMEDARACEALCEAVIGDVYPEGSERALASAVARLAPAVDSGAAGPTISRVRGAMRTAYCRHASALEELARKAG